MHCITVRAIAAQLLLICLPGSVSNFAEAQKTTTTISTTIVETQWVVLTSASSTVSTFTTATIVAGSTLGSTLVVAAPTGASSTHAKPGPSDSADMAWQGQDLQDAVLNSTNYYRAQHQASSLTWNDSLASYAQDHAQQCVFEHSGGPHGENLAMGYPTVALSIDAWGDEESDYNYKKQKFSEKAGHFTQLVWKNTTSVGCGAVNCSNTDSNGAHGWYLVCEYNPAGNVVGQFGGNVGKTGEGKDGEPGMAGAGRIAGAGRWVAAFMGVTLIAGMCI